jgi:hypothetical protein
MPLQDVLIFDGELQDDARLASIESLASLGLETEESFLNVLFDVVKYLGVSLVLVVCKQVWLPMLWIDGFLGRPIVAQPDVGVIRIGIGWYRCEFVVGVVDRSESHCEVSLFAVNGVVVARESDEVMV